MNKRERRHAAIGRRQVLLGLAALAGAARSQPAAPATPALTAEALASPPRQNAQLPPEIIEHPRVEQFLLGGSRHDGEPWRIHLARPQQAAAAGGHAVLYLLDGNASFPLAWHALQDLQERLPAARQLALVGVGYPANVRFDVERRFYDLTPPTTAEQMGRRAGTRTGGQDVFLDFIEHDLRPAIGQRLPVNPAEQALFGHSLGGLLTMHAFYTRPALFRTWLAADPSFWWNGGSILDEEAAFLAGVRSAGNRLARPARLLIEQSGGRRRRQAGDGAQQPGTTVTASMAQGPDVLASADRLAAIAGLDVWYHRFAEETHGSMLAPSIRDGLALLLDQAPAHLRRL
ncbi:alpha/beta hydrolase [Corticibacter populi]|uniref:Acyl-CoA:diacylglycerol acyltransferase n=1 Tax=Corticibacter populi TaxID=1550736 RepID=A0A3M6QZC7_9BURK|nr:alpha/beta hydrolase-fold protein [Corticibacter populi]RMX07979.1 alpha/beta hydrolase [Corticibacter populi]RZS35221.1 hypothetical protein EV687_0281 [Corticibacter populi]